jgi:hypothetical protein
MNVIYIKNQNPINPGDLDIKKEYYMILDNSTKEEVSLGRYKGTDNWTRLDQMHYIFKNANYIPPDILEYIYEKPVLNGGSRRSKRYQRRSKGRTKKRHRRKRQV